MTPTGFHPSVTDADVVDAICAYNEWGHDMLDAAYSAVRYKDSRAVALRRVLEDFVGRASGDATRDALRGALDRTAVSLDIWGDEYDDAGMMNCAAEIRALLAERSEAISPITQPDATPTPTRDAPSEPYLMWLLDGPHGALENLQPDADGFVRLLPKEFTALVAVARRKSQKNEANDANGRE